MDELLILHFHFLPVTEPSYSVGEQVLLFLALNHRRVRFSSATKGDQVYTVV